DQLESLRCRDERERDTGVAAGRLDDDGLRRDLAALEAVLDHRESDAVLHARERIEELELQKDFRLGVMRSRGAIEANERRVADGFRDVVVYFCHRGSVLSFLFSVLGS